MARHSVLPLFLPTPTYINNPYQLNLNIFVNSQGKRTSGGHGELLNRLALLAHSLGGLLLLHRRTQLLRSLQQNQSVVGACTVRYPAIRKSAWC